MDKLVYNNVVHMLRCRGIVDDVSSLDTPSVVTPDKAFITESGKTIFIIGHADKLAVKLQRGVIEENPGATRFIFINRDGFTPRSKKEADLLENKKIEYFRTYAFTFCLTKHSLYCKHSKIEDADAFLRSRKWKRCTLPTLRSDDPVARYMGFETGDLIEIEIPHFSGNKTPEYRVVRAP